MTPCRAFAVLIVAGLLAVAGCRPAAAVTMAGTIYGLVIGIDNYTGVAPKLEGAVNDARDVADALTRSGAREVKLLLDQGASRDAIMAAWDDLLKKAKKDDILIFHYAGHGGQEPEHVKGSEPTGYDSTLLLAGFDIEGDGTYERIIDDELGGMFKRASDAGISLLVVIDACHSGTMTRDFKTPGTVKPRVRAVTYPPILITDDKLPPFDPALATIPDDLPGVIYFGAVQDNEESPEITIDGRPRGALSWALAEGLRGAADANHDGVITKEELQAFITENIRMKLEGRQHPSVIPTGYRAFHFPVQTAATDQPVAVSATTPAAPASAAPASAAPVPAAPTATAPATPAAPAPPAPPAVAVSGPSAGPLPFAIVDTRGVGADELAGALKDIVPVAADAGPVLTWDVGKGQVSAGPGNVIADFTGEASRGFKRVGPPAGGGAPAAAAATAAGPSADGRGDLARDQAVIDKWRQAEPRPPAEAEGPLSLAIINASTVAAPELAGALKGVTLVEVKSEPVPMLTWDVGRGQLFTALGDLVADLGPARAADADRAFKRGLAAGDGKPPSDGRAELPKVQGVVDTWHVVERIKRLAVSRSLQMTLKPDDRLHTEGDKLTFAIEGHDQTYFTLFNLGSDGTVNFLYPLDTSEVKDPPQIPLGRPYTVPLVVDAPYGADHLVAIASARPLDGLHKALQAFDGKPDAAALETVLVGQLEGQTYRIGIHGSYTAATR